VNKKRSSSHLSVCEATPDCDFCPVDVASEMSVDLDSSILLKLARPRTYLIRMATTQRLPTTQQLNTVSILAFSRGVVLGRLVECCRLDDLLGVQPMTREAMGCFSRIGAKGTVTRMIGRRMLQALVAGTTISLKRMEPMWRML